MYSYTYKTTNDSYINAKQKHLGCTKMRGQEEPATKSSDIN